MSKPNAIKTPITADGHLELRGNSSLSALPAIFALYHTAKRTESGYALQTDADGLQTLANQGSSAATAICSALTALGDLLVSADAEDIKNQRLNDLGWLLVALGELGMDLEDARSLIEGNLQRVATQPTG